MNTVERICAEIRERQEKALPKYKGVTIDRTDLKPSQWLQHHKEELIDATLYVQREIDTMKEQEARIAALEAYVERLENAGNVLCTAASKADDDIREHLQVANYNLHGLLNSGERVTPPNPPQTIHQAGIDASQRVRETLRHAWISWNQAREAKP